MLTKGVVVMPFVLAFFLGFFASCMAAQDGSKDRVLGTAHDLNAAFHEAVDTCSFCHISHTTTTSSDSPDKVLEWNHVLPANATYTPYSSAMLKTKSLSNTFSTADAFYSLACLSCHDGSVAIAALYVMPDNVTVNSTATMSTFTSSGPINLVGANDDLSQTHPINFNYDNTLAEADRGLWDVGRGENVAQIGNTSLTAVRPALTYDPYGALQQPILFDRTVQCATCHNPHSETNPEFLRVTMQGGKLCFKCHSASAAYDS